MATVNLAKIVSSNSSFSSNCAVTTEVRIVKMADITAEKGSAAAAADVVQLFSVAKGDIILNARCISKVAGTVTATFGDGSDVDGLIASIDSAATAGTATGTAGAYLQAGTSPYAILGGKAYAAADTLDLVLGGTVAGTEQLIVVIERLSVAHLL